MPTYPATSATTGGGQITLAEIERETARRVGPHLLGASGLGEEQSAVNVATAAGRAYFDALLSSTGTDRAADLFMLRRGNMANGSTVTVIAGDRVRLADTHDAHHGLVTTDRPWTTEPVEGELTEFHFLDPERELRPAVRAGLRRCYFETRVSVTTSSASAERNLTAVLVWLTKKSQLRRVQHQATGSTVIPSDVIWSGTFEAGGHVWLAGAPDPYPDTLLVTALRPHFTWVNGADSTTGPTADADLLSLDLNYAVAAAHIEAWRMFPARMKQAAEAGYQTSQQDAADEFTRQARANIGPPPLRWQLGAPFDPVRLGSLSR